MRKGAAIRDGRLFSARQLLISPRAASAIGVLLLLIGAISTTALLIFLISLPAALVALLALDLILTLRHRYLLYTSGGHSICSAGPTYRYIGAWGLPGQGMPLWGRHLPSIRFDRSAVRLFLDAPMPRRHKEASHAYGLDQCWIVVWRP